MKNISRVNPCYAWLVNLRTHEDARQFNAFWHRKLLPRVQCVFERYSFAKLQKNFFAPISFLFARVFKKPPFGRETQCSDAFLAYFELRHWSSLRHCDAFSSTHFLLSLTFCQKEEEKIIFESKRNLMSQSTVHFFICHISHVSPTRF